MSQCTIFYMLFLYFLAGYTYSSLLCYGSEEAIFLAFFKICKALETIKSIDMNAAMCIAWGILVSYNILSYYSGIYLEKLHPIKYRLICHHQKDAVAIHLLLKHAMGNNQKPKDIYRWGLIVWYADPKENSTEWNF